MIKPLLFRVLVKPFNLEDFDPAYKSAKASGILIAETQGKVREQQAVDRGTVVAIGPIAFKEWGDDPVTNVGDEVFFAKYAGKKLTDPYTGEELLALNDEDLVASIHKEDN